MSANYDDQEICICGFGRDFFTRKNNLTICSVCQGLVKDAGLPAAETQESPAAAHKTVLIVDDRESFRGRIAQMLTDKGFSALEASDGLGGVKIINDLYGKKDTGPASHVDIILLDLIMPGALDGKSTLAAIKTIAPEIPVIILTAAPPKEELLKQLAAMGAQRYLNKTVSNLNELLVNNIRSLLA